jgi:hypothetical protein
MATHDIKQGTAESTVPDVTTSPALAAYRRDSSDRVRRLKHDVARELKEAGIAWVTVDYDGCGDDGRIEAVTCLGPDKREVPLPTNLSFTEEKLADLFEDLSHCLHPDWQDGAGANGEFTWDLVEDKLCNTHNARFIDYHTTEQDL